MGNWFKKLFGKEEGEMYSSERTLKDIKIGESATIQCLRGDASVCQRLREMGFGESNIVEKVAESGALICKICNTKVVISKKLAENIVVRDHGSSSSQVKPVLLSEMKVGERGVILDFIAESDDCERIEEMGVTPGETVELIRYAPLGDPIEIKIRGYNLSLRRAEAELIEVTPLK